MGDNSEKTSSGSAADWFLAAGLGAVLLASVFSDMALAAPAGRLCEAAVVVLAGAWLAAGIGRGRLTAPRPMLLAPAGAFALLLFVDVFRASYRYAAWGAFLHFSCGLLVFLVAAGLASHAGRARALAAVLIATAAVVAGFGVDQYVVGLRKTEQIAERAPAPDLAPEARAQVSGRFHDRRVFSVFELPNTLAGFMTLAFPLACACAAGAPRGREGRVARAVLALAAAAMVAALALTFSKAGWCVFALALAAMGWWALPPRRRRLAFGLALAAAALAALAAAAAGVLPGWKRYVWSASARWDYWRAAARMFLDHPLLGVGTGDFAEHFFRYKTPIGEETRFAHNDYLQTACETGALGFAAFAALLAAWARLAWPRRRAAAPRAGDDPAGAAAWLAAGAAGFGFLAFVAGALHPFVLLLMLPAWLAVAAAAWRSRPAALRAAAGLAAAAVLVHSVVDIHLYTQGLSFCIWAAMALALPPAAQREYRLDTPRRRLAGLGLIVLLGAACWPPVVRHARSEQARLRADQAVRRGDWAGYAQGLEDAANAAPGNAEPRAKLSALLRAAAQQCDDPARAARGVARAIELLRGAIALRPLWAAYWHWLAQLYALDLKDKPADWRQARNAERRAVALYRNQPHYCAALGDYCRRLGLRDEMVRAYRRALTVDAALRAADGPKHLRLTDARREAIERALRGAGSGA